jgi:hypothetical protein
MRPKAEILAASRRLQRRRRNFKISLYLFLVVLALGSLGFLFSRPAFFISDVKISGLHRLTAAEVRTVVEGELGSPWRRQLFLYPRLAILAALTKQFPLIGQVEVGLEDWSVLNIALSERSPAALWCAAETCRVLDQTGFDLAPGPQFSRPLFFTVRAATSTPAADLPRLLSLRANFQKIIGEFGSPVSLWEVRALAEGDYEFVVEPAEAAGPAWRLLVSSNPAEAVTVFNLRSAFSSAGLSQALRAGQINYVDLRFAPKIFYKLL